MTVAEIIQLSRNMTLTTTNMVSDVEMLTYLNRWYYKIHADIICLDKNYFQQERLADLVAGQSEYTLLDPDSGTQTFGQFKIENVGVKFDADNEYYCKAVIGDWDQFDVDDSVLKTFGLSAHWITQNYGGGSDCGFCRLDGCTGGGALVIISDSSIYVYPTPEFDVTDGLKLRGARKPYELDITMLSADILIPDEYQDLLSMAIDIDLYRKRNLLNEKNDARAEFEREKVRMLRELTNRKTTPTKTLPNRLAAFI